MASRILAVLLLGCPMLLEAQYSGLAATDDGGQLYFSSALRLRGSDEPVFPKIFQYAGEFQLFRDTGVPVPGYPFSSFQLTDPDVSGDGSVVAYTSGMVCTHSGCLFDVQKEGNIVGADIAPGLLDDGTIRLSGNHQYALMFNGVRQHTRVIELSTSNLIVLSNYNPIGDGRQAFTDDGSVLVQTADGLGPQTVWLWNPISPRPVNLYHFPVQACVSRNGTKVVYAAAIFEVNQSYGWLIAYDVPTGTERVLVATPLESSQPTFFPHITNDGRTVLYSTNDENGIQQVFLINSDGTNQQQLTREPEGIKTATLTGSGNLVYAATPTARLLRIDTASGVVTELAAATAQVSSISLPAAGSLARLIGTGLVGVNQVYVNSEAAPLFSVSDTAVVFQIPWDTSVADPARIVVEDTSGSPFESGVAALVQALYPSFLPFNFDSSQPTLTFLHQDFSGLVTAAQPAVPGEIVHFYMTGLGPVTGTVETGVPAPVGGPLQSTVNTPSCSFSYGLEPSIAAPVFFAGLAPGLVGVYQLDMQIPFGLQHSPAGFGCLFSPTEGAGGGIPVQL